MAKYDGSGDISFSAEELERIAERLLRAADLAKRSGSMYTISMSVSLGENKKAVVNVRKPRYRGPVEELEFILPELNTSQL